MRKRYSYTEAVKILGGKEHPAVAALDKVLGGALLAGSLGLWQVLDLFDAKPDFTRLFSELAAKVSEKRRGLSRFDRTQQLHAAHAVIVVTAYFEAFRELELPFVFTPQDDEHVLQFSPFDLGLPLPSTSRPYEQNLKEIYEFYRDLISDTQTLMESLAQWDRLNETEQDRLLRSLDPLADRALERYQELFRRLAAEFPEVAFWCSIEDHRATRAALARLEDVLRETTTDLTADARLAELAGVYRDALSRPLVVSADLRVPTLGEAYVDPRFQLLEPTDHSTVPSMAESWRHVPVRADLYGCLVGHLTSMKALNAPLLVLGDPGSGKSVLTEMLAARLPASDFAVVRIELRTTPVDADLVRRVEHGLHRLLDERVSWAEFSRTTGGAVPLVILDGLDELMQATGVSQTRYLTVIEEFQSKLLAKGRPAIFVVTSRLSVCAGLELPEQSHVVRLLPFSDEQVRQWLDVWNASNPPLSAEVALSYPDLAAQPLLLLMLALYEAVDGSLRRDHESLSRGQLYERLLERFARREVEKSWPDLSEADLRREVESELERLSVVALGMFNRGTQQVAEHEVTADLAGLIGMGSPNRSAGTRTPLSAGEAVLGRFFFVQKSEAIREDRTTLRTYEFLHATFGEYLVARFVWERLLDLQREDAARSRRKSTVDDTELYSVLSYMAFTTSKPVLDFLQEFAARADREALFDLVVRLIAARDETRSSRGDYAPVSLPDSVRDAKYSLNLVVLAIVLRRTVYALDLGSGVNDWQRLALFWKSRLPSSEWSSVVRGLWSVRDAERHFGLSLNSRERQVEPGWLVMAEPYVTLDEVALRLRDAITPLASRYPLEVTALLIRLAATPVERCVPDLDRLARVLPAEEISDLICARLGRGGDDLALLDLWVGWAKTVRNAEVLDAWLRLHEGGFPFSAGQTYPTVSAMLPLHGGAKWLAARPDLVKRARSAAAELGLEWPLRETGRARRDRLR
ncbi:hypothetical protein LFM09_18675 [Lentzea alba]|uniref:NACHT domain-containing protein n=1 Tax=Lentzea alba TaxID=2714351 RepID=UPI0039BEE795